MDAAQARDYLIALSCLPALRAIREHEETLEEVAMLLDDVVTLLEHLEYMPDFEFEDREEHTLAERLKNREDREWIERLKSCSDNFKSYGDKQFLENVVEKLSS